MSMPYAEASECQHFLCGICHLFDLGCLRVDFADHLRTIVYFSHQNHCNNFISMLILTEEKANLCN